MTVRSTLYAHGVDFAHGAVQRRITRHVRSAPLMTQPGHPEPHSITLDGHRPSHSALRRMGMNGKFNFRGPNPVKIRSCPYLNNIVEQDHRRVKFRLQPMLGFFYNARRVIMGNRTGSESTQSPVCDSDRLWFQSSGNLASRAREVVTRSAAASSFY
jgi:hypothetical protein